LHLGIFEAGEGPDIKNALGAPAVSMRPPNKPELNIFVRTTRWSSSKTEAERSGRLGVAAVMV